MGKHRGSGALARASGPGDDGGRGRTASWCLPRSRNNCGTGGPSISGEGPVSLVPPLPLGTEEAKSRATRRFCCPEKELKWDRFPPMEVTLSRSREKTPKRGAAQSRRGRTSREDMGFTRRVPLSLRGRLQHRAGPAAGRVQQVRGVETQHSEGEALCEGPEGGRGLGPGCQGRPRAGGRISEVSAQGQWLPEQSFRLPSALSPRGPPGSP